MRRPEENVPDVKVDEGEECLNKVAPKRNVELHVHVVPDLDHCGRHKFTISIFVSEPEELHIISS